MPKVRVIYASQPIVLRGRSVNWIARRSPKPQVCVRITTVVLSQIIYIFPKLTYQKLLENAIGGSDMTVPSSKVLVKVYVMLSRQNAI